jgi:TP901 family phage tail tape measure protein
MAEALTMKVVLQLVDEMSAAVKSAVDKSAAELNGFSEQAQRFGRSLESIGARIGGLGAGVQLGLSRLGLDMVSVTTAAIDAEKALFGIATTAGKSGEDARASVQSWTETINQVAVASNQAQGAVISALQDLVAKGISDADAMRMLEPIGRAATAAGANVRDVASAANAAFQNLGVAPENLAKSLDIMAQAGKSGAFELRDMAQYFDNLSSKANLLGMRGEAALGSLASAAQIARKGAGDASTAANNLANFLDKLSAPVTAKAFEKFGLNLAEEVKKGLASGDLIGYMGQLIQRITQGDASKVSQLFADVQAKNFIAPLIQNLQEYERIRDEALNASGVVAADFDTNMQSLSATLDKLKIAGQAALGGSDLVRGLLESLGKLADWAAAHPDVVAMLGIGSAAAVVGGGVLVGVGAVATAVGEIMPILSGVATFLAANPVVLAILGVGVAAAVIYKNWDAIVAGLDRGWTAIKTFAKNVADAIGALPQKMLELGQAVVQGLIDGIKSRIDLAIRSAKALSQAIPDVVKRVLDMRSPSRVMRELGEQTAEGYAIGLRLGAANVAAAATLMAASATGAVAGDRAGLTGPDAAVQRYAAIEQAETQHQQRMLGIRQFFESQSLATAVQYRQANVDSMGFFFSQIGGLMQTKSRQMFEVGKAGAIGETIFNTYRAAMAAYAALAGIPIVGPGLGAAAAASAIAVGMARVQAIRATNFGQASGSPVLSGGGVSGPVIGGGAGVAVPPTPANTGVAAPGIAAPAPRSINIELRAPGNVVDISWLRDTFIPSLNEAIGDGVVINFPGRA